MGKVLLHWETFVSYSMLRYSTLLYSFQETVFSTYLRGLSQIEFAFVFTHVRIFLHNGDSGSSGFLFYGRGQL